MSLFIKVYQKLAKIGSIFAGMLWRFWMLCIDGAGDSSIHKSIVICAIAKNEEAYLREWIDYHLRLGFEKIYLYDNNDVESPALEDLLGDYISANQLEIVDVRGKRGYQMRAYREFCREHFFDVSWCAFIDVDEFITLQPPYTTIQEFLNDVAAHGFREVFLNWEIYGDNGLLYNSPEPVLERFTKPVEGCYLPLFIKSIARIQDVVYFSTPHFGYCAGRICRSDFRLVRHPRNNMEEPIYQNAFIRHYFTKTLEEFLLNKLKRGCSMGSKTYFTDRLKDFYQINDRTPEKEALEQRFIEEYFPEHARKELSD